MHKICFEWPEKIHMRSCGSLADGNNLSRRQCLQLKKGLESYLEDGVSVSFQTVWSHLQVHTGLQL